MKPRLMPFLFDKIRSRLSKSTKVVDTTCLYAPDDLWQILVILHVYAEKNRSLDDWRISDK